MSPAIPAAQQTTPATPSTAATPCTSVTPSGDHEHGGDQQRAQRQARDRVVRAADQPDEVAGDGGEQEAEDDHDYGEHQRAASS